MNGTRSGGEAIAVRQGTIGLRGFQHGRIIFYECRSMDMLDRFVEKKDVRPPPLGHGLQEVTKPMQKQEVFDIVHACTILPQVLPSGFRPESYALAREHSAGLPPPVFSRWTQFTRHAFIHLSGRLCPSTTLGRPSEPSVAGASFTQSWATTASASRPKLSPTSTKNAGGLRRSSAHQQEPSAQGHRQKLLERRLARSARGHDRPPDPGLDQVPLRHWLQPPADGLVTPGQPLQ